MSRPPPAGLPGPSVRRVPDGDTHERLVCPDCGFVNYENPKIVVGAVAAWRGRVLLCRRAINPRKGFWTLPAGYMELHETSIDGASREAWEEARARLTIRGLLAVYNIPRISQVQLIYAAHLASPDVAPGPESAEVALFEWDEIPWGQIAFPSVRWALDHWRALGDAASFAPQTNPAGDLGDMTE
jgi:ADP-ribose pyrophosphatase YjhB (NUDIX family)